MERYTYEKPIIYRIDYKIGAETYVFKFTDDTRAECLRTLGRFATDPALSFSWHDVAVVSCKVRNRPMKDIQ